MPFLKSRLRVLLVVQVLLLSFIFSSVVKAQTTINSPSAVPASSTIPIVLPPTDGPKPLIAPIAKETATPSPFLMVKAQHTVNPNGRISFFFQNIDIRTLLQLLAKNSGVNFIISDTVKGAITLNLKNVTWQEALDIILKSHGLAAEHIDNAIFISTAEDIDAQTTKKLQSRQQYENLSPLSTTMLNLKYTDATGIAKLLKGDQGTLLTARGEVAVDPRTNSVIVRDVQSNLMQITRYIRRLDIPARQVSIEARIVNIDTTYEAQLGVRFGLSNTRSFSGTLDGANQLAQGINPAFVNPLDHRLNFDIPASILSTGVSPASVGLALARLGPVLLDLELSALEEEGHSQLVSKPRVVTSNQQKAIIQTGVEIPYQQATSSGATSIEFKKAVLSLEIVPQITPDDRIILHVKANQDSQGQSLVLSQTNTNGSTIPTAFGPPTINTQALESFVLLKNNETAVVGGIYKVSKSNTLDRVPFFGYLPVVGNLFKHRAIKNEKTELLIFLTPHIIRMNPTHLAFKGEG